VNTCDVARCCETDCGARRARREGPSHVVTAAGVCDVSHNAPTELVAAMVNAAAASYETDRKTAAMSKIYPQTAAA
jgi:hypothetical protein